MDVRAPTSAASMTFSNGFEMILTKLKELGCDAVFNMMTKEDMEM